MPILASFAAAADAFWKAPPSPYLQHAWMLAGRFRDAATAALAAESAPDSLPATWNSFGSLVFVRCADPDAGWQGAAEILEASGGEVLRADPREGRYVHASVSFTVAPALAESLAEAIAAQLAAPYYFSLRPPWCPLELAPPLREDERAARRAWWRLTQRVMAAGSAGILGYASTFLGASMANDRQGMTDAFQSHADQMRRLQDAALAEFLAEPENAGLDPLFGPRYAEFSSPPSRGAGGRLFDPDQVLKSGRELGELMGQMPPGDPAEAYLTLFGDLERQASKVTLPVLVFCDVPFGLPAFFDFIQASGARQIRFELTEAEPV